ncbi:hypothetical protein NPIL_244851 [Nephila pilipes]|uniref:Uncharacterized protein n=1 Tax=Nephila pilipes TaxID=299642 RepID=A0A8X6PF73_NEPPI|nr:hypothetical protein NPIL_244851 [Nephila pilipes]
MEKRERESCHPSSNDRSKKPKIFYLPRSAQHVRGTAEMSRQRLVSVIIKWMRRGYCCWWRRRPTSLRPVTGTCSSFIRNDLYPKGGTVYKES